MHICCGYLLFKPCHSCVEIHHPRQLEEHGFHNHVYPHTETDLTGYSLGIDYIEISLLIGNSLTQGCRKFLCKLLIRPAAIKHKASFVTQLVNQPETVYICILMAGHIICILDAILGSNRLFGKTQFRHRVAPRFLRGI